MWSSRDVVRGVARVNLVIELVELIRTLQYPIPSEIHFIHQ